MSTCFLLVSRTTSSGWHYSKRAGPSHTNHQSRNASEACPQANLMTFSQLRLSLLKWLWFVSVCHKTSQNTIRRIMFRTGQWLEPEVVIQVYALEVSSCPQDECHQELQQCRDELNVHIFFFPGGTKWNYDIYICIYICHKMLNVILIWYCRYFI